MNENDARGADGTRKADSDKERDLAGRVVVVTGASSGFGKGTALRLAEEGAHVVLAARRGDLLQAMAEELEAAGRDALVVPTDVSRRDDVEALAAAAIARHGRIDVWINNAGVGAIGPFDRVPLPDHEQVLATNLFGTLYGSWFACRQFLVQGHGTLINLASELGMHTVPYYTSYAAAKHGIVGLGDALRQEIAQSGHEHIHVCSVMPTAHDTPFFDHAANYTGHEVQAPQPLHDPWNVVETLVRLVRDPEDKEIVGGDGFVKVWLKRLAPGLAEKMAGKQMHKTQMERAPRATDRPGALHEPSPHGTEVAGGRLEGR